MTKQTIHKRVSKYGKKFTAGSRKFTKPHVIEYVYDKWVDWEKSHDAGREGYVGIAVTRLNNGWFRVFDYCNEALQPDGEEIDVYIKPDKKDKALSVAEYCRKKFPDFPRKDSDVLVKGFDKLPFIPLEDTYFTL